jgi:serine/threonine protein kinase
VLVPARPASGSHPAKLTDFGIAHVVGGDSLTKTGDIIGTDAYMAPEQAAGREAGPAADLYALALVLYEALTGVNPVAGIRRGARLGAHLPPVRRQRRDLPRELGRSIDLALRPRPRERGTIAELRAGLTTALDELSDVPGVVEGPWRPRIPRTEREPGPAPIDRRIPARAAAIPWQERGLASAGAALFAGWVAAHTLAATMVAPAAVALLAAGLVLAMPRVGFGAVTALLVLGAALAGHSGAALVILIAALIPIVLLPRDGTAWPVAIGAPALGLVGLAGAWPALAARAGSAWRRAALGATGWLWLALATPLTGSSLYLIPHGTPPLSVWSPSAYDAVHHVLSPLLTGGVLAAALVWAGAAVVLPWLVARRSLALDAARVLAWTVIVVLCSEASLRLGSGARLAAPDTAILGAVAAALVALGPSILAAWRPQPRSEVRRAGLP